MAILWMTRRIARLDRSASELVTAVNRHCGSNRSPDGISPVWPGRTPLRAWPRKVT